MNRTGAPDFGGFKRLCGEAAAAPARGPDQKRPIWIFGAGHFGRDACAGLRGAGFQVKGFIESRPAAAKALDLPVKTWDDFAPGGVTDQLAIGIFNRLSPLNELEALARSAGFRDIFMPWDLYARLGAFLGWRFWLSGPRAILGDLSRIERAYHCLADDESRLCFLRILAFRLGKDTEYAGFKHGEPQYFNAITLGALPQELNYVDGGAYNGDTLLELLRHRKVVSAWLFEPEPGNFRALVGSVGGLGIEKVCLPLGLMDDCRILAFKAGGGDASAVSDQGTAHISAAALDQVLPGHRIDFIKLDIEGSEIQALRGAARLIRSSRPVLAVSLYHRPGDLWDIPLELMPLCPDYKFFIRQHYFNSFESVLYAIPQSV